MESRTFSDSAKLNFSEQDSSNVKEKIEPPEASVFIDQIFENSEHVEEYCVIWAGCPGAGGYDDIVIFILGDQDIVKILAENSIKNLASSEIVAEKLLELGGSIEILKNLKVKVW